jgi:hypothetical protein
LLNQIDITQLDQVFGFVAWLGVPSVWLCPITCFLRHRRR